MSKATNLTQLRALAARNKTEADALSAQIQSVSASVPTVVSALENDAGYQTGAEVSASIQSAISATGHAHFEKAESVPTAETAAENVLYLVMNADTGHYDIYALVSGEVVLIDDTTVDLSAYSTTEEMNAAIEGAAVEFATDEEVSAMLDEVYGTTGA